MVKIRYRCIQAWVSRALEDTFIIPEERPLLAPQSSPLRSTAHHKKLNGRVLQFTERITHRFLAWSAARKNTTQVRPNFSH